MNKNDSFERLSLLFIRLTELQKKLLSLQEEKTKILVEGDINELDRLMTQEQPLILKCASLEKQRMELLEEMGLSDLSLAGLTEICDPEGEYGFAVNLAELKEVLLKLKKRNAQNNKILYSRLAVIGQCMSLLGMAENAPAYKEDGHF